MESNAQSNAQSNADMEPLTLFTIREATTKDAEALVNIYAYYVKNTAITFEYEVPSVEEFAGRIENTLKKYPYFVALIDEKAVGYAYAGSFHSRDAYQWNVETSIYIDKDYRQCGTGRALYLALETALKEMNVLKMNACISVENETCEDCDSVRFHKAMGFEMNGITKNAGFKEGRWYGIVWMDKYIGECTDKPKKILAWGQVN